jgi:uncharacterized protein (TIGR02246 family)
MRGRLAAACAALLLTAGAARADDSADVRASVEALIGSWAAFDSAGVASHYTDDAIWQNPFGVRLRGTRELKAFLDNLFRRPGYRSGKDVAPAKVTDIRIVAPGVATAWTLEVSRGEIDDSTGKPMAERRSHYLEVLVKRDGRWLITDDMIMDEK